MRLKRSKTGDAMARPSRRSSFLGDAGAKFFCETEQTGQDALEILPHPGLRFALNASPYGRRRASLRPGCGSCKRNSRTKQTSPTSSKIPIEGVGVKTFRRRTGLRLRHLVGRLFRGRRWSLDQLACGNRGLLCLRISFWQEGENWFRIRFPAEPTETLADRFFAEAKPAGNPSITHPLGFEAENSLVSLVVFLAHSPALRRS
jgi:hypothetical protein